MCIYCGESTCDGNCWSSLFACLQRLFCCCCRSSSDQEYEFIDEESKIGFPLNTEISATDSSFDDGYKPEEIPGVKIADPNKIQLDGITSDDLGINYDSTNGGYSVAWIPKVSDINQSSRMGNCWMLTALLTLID